MGTIAYYFIEALDCPLPSNEAIAHAYYDILRPSEKGTIILSVSSIAIISGNEIVEISMRDNIKTLYIKLSLHHGKSFHAAPTRMQR